jgi:hypothetical protein
MHRFRRVEVARFRTLAALNMRQQLTVLFRYVVRKQNLRRRGRPVDPASRSSVTVTRSGGGAAAG